MKKLILLMAIVFVLSFSVVYGFTQYDTGHTCSNLVDCPNSFQDIPKSKCATCTQPNQASPIGGEVCYANSGSGWELNFWADVFWRQYAGGYRCVYSDWSINCGLWNSASADDIDKDVIQSRCCEVSTPAGDYWYGKIECQYQGNTKTMVACTLEDYFKDPQCVSGGAHCPGYTFVFCDEKCKENRNPICYCRGEHESCADAFKRFSEQKRMDWQKLTWMNFNTGEVGGGVTSVHSRNPRWTSNCTSPTYTLTVSGPSGTWANSSSSNYKEIYKQMQVIPGNYTVLVTNTGEVGINCTFYSTWELEGDLLTSETFNFKDSNVDADVVVNAYSYGNPDNPYPVEGQYTYTYQVYDIREGNVKAFGVCNMSNFSNAGYSIEDGNFLNFNLAENTVPGCVFATFGNNTPLKLNESDNISYQYINNETAMHPGDKSAIFYFTSPYGYGNITGAIIDQPIEKTLLGPNQFENNNENPNVPEFSKTSIIAIVVVVAAALLVLVFRERIFGSNKKK